MEKDFVITVNSKDQKIGLKEKINAHLKNGVLHRAFVVFVTDGSGKVLIQRRSKNKMLWPSYWECTLASHPRLGEDYVKAGRRRLMEELGFNCHLRMLDKFQYLAKYKNIGAEREVCAVLIGEYNGKIKPNPKEVAEWKWVRIDDLKEDIIKNPRKYAPWLAKSFDILFSNFEKIKVLKNKKIDSVLEKMSKIIMPVMKNLLNSYIGKRFQELVQYQISSGGKRLRPALAIISCKLLGGKTEDILYPAAGFEILHNYTLIIDDIIDNSFLRRGKPTVWAKFGESIAQCIGIYYSATIFQTTKYSKVSNKISEILAESAKIVSDGEILDILFERTGRENEQYILKNRYQNISEKDYLEMVVKKTATLFKNCCEAGGICAGAGEKEIKLLSNYGFNLGIVFQIRDDVLDIFGNEKKFGKKIGKDIQERKAGNIIIVFALKELSQSDRKKLNNTFRKKEISDQDIKEVIGLIKKTDALRRAKAFGYDFVQKAKENLKLLPQNQWNALLADLVDFVANREK